MTPQEDNLTGRQPHRNTTTQEDDLTETQPYRKTSSREDDLTGRQDHSKKNIICRAIIKVIGPPKTPVTGLFWVFVLYTESVILTHLGGVKKYRCSL